jgi:hypothetical protein
MTTSATEEGATKVCIFFNDSGDRQPPQPAASSITGGNDDGGWQ